jgi:site-specific DNA recombinase
LGICNSRHTNIQQEKCLNLYETDLIDKEIFTGRIKELNTELERLMLQRNEIEDSLQGCDAEELSYEYVKQMLANLNTMLKSMANDEKKLFYHMIIEEIVVNDDKKIQSIKLKIDEQMQEDIMKQSLFDKTSNRDIFVFPEYKKVLHISL